MERVRIQPDPFLDELTSMFERTTENGSVWVTLKHSSDKSKVERNKMKKAGEKIEFRCLIRATDGNKTISTVVCTFAVMILFTCWAKRPPALSNFTHNYFETRMTALKKREKKDERKATDSDRKQGGTSKKSSSSVLFFARNINIIQE
ncbi:hypothetical protein M9H77_26726 [Catharanthus roseus]|uniref:Uncharacterized protein n=1 Tax=Catharanthus roseus TaxID=4058 RepID=A0ACC0AD76_CATRO|nr:hypothetical protein M9H77_26726 [Catharanthus roseus]